jgi:ribosomal-protein-alanine N-acetyltransferase
MLLNKLFKEVPELRTERLILRKSDQSDAQDLMEFFSDPDVLKYYNLEPIKTIEEIKGLIKDTEQSFRDCKAIRWGIYWREADKLIGTCGFHNIDEESSKLEVGFELSQSFWGKGIMKEAVEQILQFAFEQIEVNRVEALVEPGNIASQKLLEKMYFTREGLLREYKFNKGRFRDLVISALLKSDYYST